MKQQKRITKKRIIEFLEMIGKKEERKYGRETYIVWVSKIDGSYICFDDFSAKDFYQVPGILLKLGITEQIQNSKNDPNRAVNIGFNPEEQKWYGWSHRAVYGFGIGSKVQRGDIAYKSTNPDDFARDLVEFWKGPYKDNVRAVIEKDGVRVEWEYNEGCKNKKLIGKTNSIFHHFPEQWGRGEWEAKTLEDAKKMAIDFAENIG